ncbi:MAG: sulfurtransferase [Woeseia sp.]
MTEFKSLISVAELEQHVDDANLRIVDCRFDLLHPAKGYEDYLKSHIQGAVYAHLDDDLAAPITASSGRHPLPAAEQFVATLERLGISNDSQVVVYDAAAGGIAARLWWMLRWLGHDAVAVLDGGYAAWTAAGKPLETTVPEREQGSFTPRERSGWVITTEELASQLAEGRPPTLVDAREAPRYRGEQEPIDTAAGHIPGAVNQPFAQNLAADGRWRSSADLAQSWRALFGGEPPAGWAVMCGSGVTACHLALAAERAGLSPPRLYAGSWSEWIRDPQRPRLSGPAAG